MKNVRKTWDLDPASRTKARKVEKPPLKTAGPKCHNLKKKLLKLETIPISVKASFTLSSLVPALARKA